MVLLGGILLVLAGFMTNMVGRGAMRDSRNHWEYGVSSESRHRAFSRVLIVGGMLCMIVGTYLVLKGLFG